MSKIKVINIEFDNVTIEEAACGIYKLLDSHKGYIVTPNAEIAYSCITDKPLLDAVERADFVLPDGAGVVMASKICGEPLKARAAGYDVALALVQKMAEGKRRLFLLGAKPGIAQSAAAKLIEKNPGIVIAGIHHGYFKEDAEVLDEIITAEPDMVFVALGSPRQEFFMLRNKDKINAVMMGLGGSLDVFAGEVKRAPKIFIRLNLEWLYRLIKEPWRFKRMLRLPAYVLKAVKWRLTKKQQI